MKKILQITKLTFISLFGMMWLAIFVSSIKRYFYYKEKGWEYSDEVEMIVVAGVFSALSIIFFIKVLKKDRCPECKRLMALEVVDEVLLNKENISVLKEVKHYNRNYEVIGTSEQYIPGTRRNYQICHVCKYCGAKCYSYKKIDSENV